MLLGTWAATIPSSGVGSFLEITPHVIDCQHYRSTFGCGCYIGFTSNPAEGANSGWGALDIGVEDYCPPRSRGSSRSRRASPNILKPNTAALRATPGQMASQGA